MTVLNTNLGAIAAQNSLRTTGLKQTTAMERLSSGIRINSAKDDAAGLAITTRMTANIRGLAAAVRNANDGISLTQTAEGGLSSIGDNLQRIRELAVQSANTGNSESDRAALNKEAQQLVSEIDRVANNSSFNGIKLLDGSFQNQSLQVGAGSDANDRIAISIGSAKVSALGIGSNSSYSKILAAGTNVPTAALVAGDLSISGAQIGASVSDGVSFRNADGSAIAKAAAINAASGLTGVTATVGKTTVIGAAATSMSATVANAVMINGVDIGPITGTATSAVDRGTQTAAAVNSKTSQTGVTAVADAGTGVVTLTAADGRNITVSSTTAGGESTGLKTTTNGAASAVVGALTSSDTITINGVSVGAVTAGASTAGDQMANIVAAINNLTTQTGVTATATLSALGTAGVGGFISLSIASGDGRGIEISGSAAALGKAGVAAQASSTTSKITLSTNGPNGIVLGGSLGLAATGQTQGYSPSVLMSSGGVDLSTATGSQAALSVLDKAINTVTDSRASMGAYQNRLTASVANLEVTSMNLQASRSRILDTDYAKETTNLAKSQIIQQAATAMLAQANQSAQSVLALLK